MFAKTVISKLITVISFLLIIFLKMIDENYSYSLSYSSSMIKFTLHMMKKIKKKI